MKIIAFTKYGDRAASTRQRLLQYIPSLKHAGIEMELSTLLDNKYISAVFDGRNAKKSEIVYSYMFRLCQLIMRRDYDAIWVHCEFFPYFPGFFEWLAFTSKKPVIYDFDDAIFHQYDHHSNTLVRRVLGGKLKPLLTGAAACICGNAYLRDYAARFCERSVIIPTVLDVEIYRPAMPAEYGGRPVAVGWIGSPSTWSYVEPYVPALRSFARHHSASIRAVGAGRQAKPYPEVQFIDWSEDTEVAEIHAMDIGIMPLPDEPWARGKCGYKLIQYMACGLPVIASPVGVNSHIVVHGENGFLASTEAEWLDALTRLAADPALRRRMGLAGRARVEAEFSLQVHAPRMVDLIRSVVR